MEGASRVRVRAENSHGLGPASDWLQLVDGTIRANYMVGLRAYLIMSIQSMRRRSPFDLRGRGDLFPNSVRCQSPIDLIGDLFPNLQSGGPRGKSSLVDHIGNLFPNHICDLFPNLQFGGPRGQSSLVDHI